MDFKQIHERWPGYWEQSVGQGAPTCFLVCGSSRRITFFASKELALAAKYVSCGRGCDRYTDPHQGYQLEHAPAPKPAKVSASWQRWVDSQ